MQLARRSFIAGMASLIAAPAVGLATPPQADRLYVYNYQLQLWSVIDAVDGYFTISPNAQYVAMKVTSLSKDDIRFGPNHYVDSITMLPNQDKPYRMAVSRFHENS